MIDMDTDTGAALRAVKVRDVMTAKIVTCEASVPLAEVAELMTKNRIHSVVVLVALCLIVGSSYALARGNTGFAVWVSR